MGLTSKPQKGNVRPHGRAILLRQNSPDGVKESFCRERFLEEPVAAQGTKTGCQGIEAADDQKPQSRVSLQTELHKALGRHDMTEIIENQQVRLLSISLQGDESFGAFVEGLHFVPFRLEDESIEFR